MTLPDRPVPPAPLGLTPRQPLTGGHRNIVWLCEGPTGAVVAKSTRRSEDQIRWLTPLHAAARAAGFQVPPLRPGPDGQLVQHGWTAEPLVTGRAATAADMRALAPQIHAFHRLCPQLPQRPGFASLRDLLTRTRSGDTDLSTLPTDVLTRLRTAWAAVAFGPTQAIHGDLGPGNVILTPTGPCLIDWDEARIDMAFLDLTCSADLPALMTAAHLAWEIASCWQAEPDHARHLLATFASQATPQR